MLSRREPKKFKTSRIKKIKHTNPGESTRNYKNKPMQERIGGRNKKSTKKVWENYVTAKRNYRNNKTGLNNIEAKINKDHSVDFSTYPYDNFTDFDIYMNTENSSFIKKVNRCLPEHTNVDGVNTYYNGILSPSGKHLIKTTEICENGRIISFHSEKIII